jgi:UPF0271 protein
VLANAICAAIRTFNPELSLYGLAGSELIAAARHADLNAVEEVFADRAYEADGSLVARSKPGAMIENDADAIAQTLMLVKQKQVKAIDGSLVEVNAQTVCLHGDGAHWISRARFGHACTPSRLPCARRHEGFFSVLARRGESRHLHLNTGCRKL